MSHMRRASSLRNVVAKRSSINAPVNLNCLVRVYLLDGSSKVLQMFSNSIARDVLIALKFNLDLNDISTFALFRVVGNNVRRVELNEVITDVMKDPTNSGQEVRLLFRSWITFKYGSYDHEVFQHVVRSKQANTALWLAFMEAVFMCMTGKFYLSEDESIMLGCLKMQSDSGDFNPTHHDLRIIKNRVSSRFPEPVRSKMKLWMQQAATNPAAADNAEDLAIRVQSLYARIAGKSKVEAQINYLESLRTWCPFYGSTLYEVQCQYDDNPLDPSSSPPVIAMNAWIGPSAIFLLTATEPPIIMRHPYRRIIKWVTLPDKHIFTYWVIKPNVTLSDLEEFQDQQRRKLRRQKAANRDSENDDDDDHNSSNSDGEGDDHAGATGDMDAQQFCDCVYLVTSQVKELDYLVKSYVEALAGTAPVLPGASPELLPVKVSFGHTSSRSSKRRGEGSEEEEEEDNQETEDEDKNGNNKKQKAVSAPPIQNAEAAKKPRVGRLSLFFSSLGGDGLGQAGTGMFSDPNNHSDNDDDDHHNPPLGEEHFGDDTAAVTNSWFRNMYSKPSNDQKKTEGNANKPQKRGSVLADEGNPDEISCQNIPMNVKYAASMSELKRMAEESQFSDEEEDPEDDDEDEDEDDDSEDGKKGDKKNKKKQKKGKSGSEDESEDGNGSSDEDDEDDEDQRVARKKLPGISSSIAFRRASKILFG